MGFFPNLKIAQKLPLAVLGSALLVSAGVGTASYLIGSSTVDQMSQRQMQTVAAERSNQFTTFLAGLQSDLVNSAAADNVQTSVRDFTIGWGQYATKKPPLDVVAAIQAAHQVRASVSRRSRACAVPGIKASLAVISAGDSPAPCRA